VIEENGRLLPGSHPDGIEKRPQRLGQYNSSAQDNRGTQPYPGKEETKLGGGHGQASTLNCLNGFGAGGKVSVPVKRGRGVVGRNQRQSGMLALSSFATLTAN